jgi:predicted cation transporter
MNARRALIAHRISLATVALVAPRTAGRLFGLDFDAQPQAAVLTRLMASRNLALGAGLLFTSGTTSRVIARMNAAVDLIDLLGVTEETRRRAIPLRATVIGGLTASSGAALSQLAARS